MSGFERSAPIPGSQGPRRSQMKRINNAPPPLTPWRAEVLQAQKEAQRQVQAAKGRQGSPSRSRSPPRQAKKKRDRGDAGAGSAGSQPSAPSSRRPDAVVAPEAVTGASASATSQQLRQAKIHGEGWYAAVARAAENWNTVKSNKMPPPPALVPEEPQPPGKKSGKEQVRQKKQGKDGGEKAIESGSGKRKADEPVSELDRRRREEQSEAAKLEEEQREVERQRVEFEARAEERRLKADDERRRAEEERKKNEGLKKQRQQRLKGAFAVDDEDDQEDGLREAELVRMQKRNRVSHIAEVPLGVTPPASLSREPAAPSGSTVLSVSKGPVDPELSEKLRFEPGLNPAEAFMRLQERKRKGRRTEFGGPPRGCSPWRDGKRGVTFEKDGEERQASLLTEAALASGRTRY